LIGKDAPYFIPKPSRVKHDVRYGKRGILDGIKWAQEGRAMADVEIVIKRGPDIPLVDQTGAEEECRRFDEIVAEDEELAAYIDEIGAAGRPSHTDRRLTTKFRQHDQEHF
jgi:hypothetical protein